MGQVSLFLRSTGGPGGSGFTHWCPGCGETHYIRTAGDAPGPKWTFNGDPQRPTFGPSVKITGVETVKDAQGEWTGEWVKGTDGKAKPMCCHYFIVDGQLQFCGDSTHALAGKTVPLPELPPHLRDRDAGASA